MNRSWTRTAEHWKSGYIYSTDELYVHKGYPNAFIMHDMAY